MKIIILIFSLIISVQSLWICPSENKFPTNSDIFEEIHEIQKDQCIQFSIPNDFLAFLVKSSSFISLDSFQENSLVIPLGFYPSYFIVGAHESILPELDLALLGTSRQIIHLKSRRYEKLRPTISLNQQVAEKDEIINRIVGKDYYSALEQLTGEKPVVIEGRTTTLKTRYTHTQSNLDSGTWLRQRLESFGYQAFFQPFRYSGKETRNIIGVKKGSELPNEIVVIGAHMDSISPDPNNLAPGCIDNGSGTEAVMSIAQAFMNSTTKRTIHFILFGAEEQGLIGSNYYVDNLKQNGYNVVKALVMDMIGYSNRYFGVKIETSASAANRQLGDLMESNIKTYASNLTVQRSTNYFGSDHVPFIDNGIPCFLAIEQDDTNYVGYHRTTDRINYLNVDQSIAIARALAGTLYDLAA